MHHRSALCRAIPVHPTTTSPTRFTIPAALMFEAIALARNWHDACVVQRAIEQCSSERGVLAKVVSHWQNRCE